MIKLNHTIKWFTIVELIVVITILAILWTIWFVSYVSHISTSRDATRISQIQIINQALVWEWKWKIPLPDDNVIVYASWVIIWYQWYAWKNILSDIWINNWWKDPSDNSYYTYFTDVKQKYVQVLSFLEKSDSWEVSYNRFITKANAVDNSKKYPITYWEKLWVMVQSGAKIPIQEISAIIKSWLDVVTTTWSYIAYFSQNKYISWSWKVLQKIQQSIAHGWVWLWAPKKCPDWFIKVPWNIDFNQPGFCVMKYEATYEDATTPNSSLWWVDFNTTKFIAWKIPVSKPWLYSIADITQQQAIDSCKSMWDWYHLITNDEWMTVARNIEQVWTNWSWNEVGSWWIFRWITNEANSTTSLGCQKSNSNWSWVRPHLATSLNFDTTKFGSNKWSDCDSKRQHILLNWNIIWDLSWGVREHVNWVNNINETWTNFSKMQWNVCWTNAVRHSFAWTDLQWFVFCNFASPYSYASMWPKTSNMNANNGIGRIFSLSSWLNTRIFMRWGDWEVLQYAGIYTLSLQWGASDADRTIGFRCAK